MLGLDVWGLCANFDVMSGQPHASVQCGWRPLRAPDDQGCRTVAKFVDRLGGPRLHAAELCVMHVRADLPTSPDTRTRSCKRWSGVLGTVEVELAKDRPALRGFVVNIQRLAWRRCTLTWRRWPAPDAPDLQAAKDADERACARAAEVGLQEY